LSGKSLDSAGGRLRFQPIHSEPIIHGPGRIDPVMRTPESRERYYSEKITELAMNQQELGRTTRERNALARALEQIATSDSPDGAQRFAADVLAKLANGELRKPIG
jgi:hypothetical protein